jgi:dTDP-4-dehydrorhamnose 3,5-epimerase
MIFRETALKGAIELEPHGDERGQFVRTWCRDEFSAPRHRCRVRAERHSINTQRGTLRGLHWQAPPHEEAKLVRCSRGAICDVIADLRPNSPTFGHCLGITLTAQSQ